MSRYSVPVGTMIDDGDDLTGMVIDPAWSDERIAEEWNNSSAWWGDPVAPPFRRLRLHAHSARQLREEPQAYDEWWSQEGELKSSITVAEHQQEQP